MGARGKGGRSPGGRALPLHDQHADALGGDTVATNRNRRTRVLSLRKGQTGWAGLVGGGARGMYGEPEPWNWQPRQRTVRCIRACTHPIAGGIESRPRDPSRLPADARPPAPLSPLQRTVEPSLASPPRMRADTMARMRGAPCNSRVPSMARFARRACRLVQARTVAAYAPRRAGGCHGGGGQKRIGARRWPGNDRVAAAANDGRRAAVANDGQEAAAVAETLLVDSPRSPECERVGGGYLNF